LQALSAGSLVGRTADLRGGGVGSSPCGCMLKKRPEFCQLRFWRWWRGFETRQRNYRVATRVRDRLGPTEINPAAGSKVCEIPMFRALYLRLRGRENRFLRGRNCFGIGTSRRCVRYTRGPVIRSGTMLRAPGVAFDTLTCLRIITDPGEKSRVMTTCPIVFACERAVRGGGTCFGLRIRTDSN
jgi:hypothetical protein